jgi:hypothetical protein
MPSYIPVPDPITPAWLTTVLGEGGLLGGAEVLSATSLETGAFNSATSRLQLRYSAGASPDLPAQLILKRNISEPWAIEAGAAEVAFYQLVAALDPPPPAIVPCYAAAYDPASGNSYLLLLDLSETHAPPVTRDQQASIVEAVPSAPAIERAVGALAQHHAYWWDHPQLAAGAFEVGYWSRNAERFALYFERRRGSWENLLAHEAGWFPAELRDLYERVFVHLRKHWERYLEPRFREHRHLTLIHSDAYFANVLCPKDPAGGMTYLIDWQSPVVDIGAYDLANLCATFWTSEQRQEGQREQQILRHYHRTLQAHGVDHYTWDELMIDYQSGLIYWLLVPVQDRQGGAPKEYWWPKMQCLVAAFREWRCETLLGIVRP